MSITRDFAELIANTTYDDLSPEAITVTKTSIMDTLGIMFPATTLSESAAVVHDLYTELNGEGECSLVGYREKGSLLTAGFINGALCHAADFDDCASLDQPTIHPTACVMPAALATAEYMGGVTGKEFITAVAVANEVGVRLGFAPKGDMLKEYGFFGQTVIGNFMAAAAAAKLMKLDVDQTVSALGLVVNRCSGPFKSLFTCDFRGFRDAFIAQDGLTCALFAQRGLKGCATALEVLFEVIYRNDIDPTTLEQGLGTQWLLADKIGYKPWPSCGSSYPFVQGVLDIMREQGLTEPEIAKVQLIGCSNGYDTYEPKAEKCRPTATAGAKSALPYIVATAMVNGNIVLGDFSLDTLAALQQPEGKLAQIVAATDKLEYVLDESYSSVEAKVVIATTDGREFASEVHVLRGSVKNPMSNEELVAKFKGNAALAKAPLEPEQIDRLCDLLLNLETVEDMALISAELA